MERGELAEVFVAEVGDGLLVQVGVVGVEGVAEGGIHRWGCGDAIDAAVTGMRAKIAGATQRRLICQRLRSDEQLPINPNTLGAGASSAFNGSFTPSASGGTNETAKIVINDNPNNSPRTVLLKGAGH
jgi:hypothetical protein